MKKIIIASVLFLFLSIVPHVFAAGSGFTALAPIPGLTSGNMAVVDSTTLSTFFNNLYKYLIGLAAILAIIEIIYGGIRIATNQDNVSVLSSSKSRIWQAILGLVLVLSPVLVFSIINPSILNLSLDLPKLDTAASTATGTGSGATAQTVATGCQVTNSTYTTAVVVCPSTSTAQSYRCPNGLTTKTLPVCKNQNPNTGLCEDTGGINVSCSGKTLNVVVYHYTGKPGIIFTSITSNNVVPRDTQAVSTFTSGCTANGRKVTTALTSASIITCPSDAQIPNYDANTYSGVGCQNETLTCN